MGSSKAGAGRELGESFDMRFNDRAQRTPIGSGCHDDDRSGSLIRRVRVSREGEITEEKKDAALKGGATKRATKTAARTAEHRNVAPGFSPAFDRLTPLQTRKPKKSKDAALKGGATKTATKSATKARSRFPGRRPQRRSRAAVPPINRQGTG